MKLGTVTWYLTAPDHVDRYRFFVDRSAEIGLQALGLHLYRTDAWRDAAYLEGLAEYAHKRSVRLTMGGVIGNFYLTGADAEAEVARCAEIITSIARHMGIRFASVGTGPIATHRFLPGREERLATAATNLAQLHDAVSVAGVTLAIENHCDWRAAELVDIITRSGRPIKVQLDTGNAFAVFEDPVDCARTLAPYTLAAHIKDIAVTPIIQTGDSPGIHGVNVPLGEGHVDNAAICEILQEQSPDPANLPLMIEPFYLPAGTDPYQFLQTCADWARLNLAKYLD